MGFKKGRSARAIANAVASSTAEAASDKIEKDSLNIWHDGESCAYYTASNGSEYKIDVAIMEQINVNKGTQRKVHRRQVHDKSWTMWQFEASRPQRHYNEKRNGSPSNIAYMQYPKYVQFALEDRWRHFQQVQSASGRESIKQQANIEAWMRVVHKLDELAFASVFQVSEQSGPHNENASLDLCRVLDGLDTDEELDVNQVSSHLLRNVAEDIALQHVLFDRLLNSHMPSEKFAHAIRRLLQFGFKASAAHCQKIALSCGSLAALRVLIMEAKVNVCGLHLLSTGSSASGKQASTGGHSGWIQNCKHAVKVLLARGAVLGGQGSRSKLLKRLESDGDALFARRLLDAMGEVLPEYVILQLDKFLGLSIDSAS